MAESKFKLENFANPPEKVMKMFEAVMELIKEKADVKTMTVQSITTRAGIGKGTAYEYFKSKEEIIILALLFDYANKIQILTERFATSKSFKDKCFIIMDWLEENQEYNMSFVSLLQMLTGGGDFCNVLEQNVPEEVFNAMNVYILSEGDAMLEEGYKEGFFTEQDIVKRRIAFTNMIMSPLLCQGHELSQLYYPISVSDAKQLAWDNLIKTL